MSRYVKTKVYAILGFVGNLVGNVIGDLTGTVTGQVLQPASAITATGVIPLTSYMVEFDSTAGAIAASLADGTVGQEIVLISVESTAADVVITPANFVDGVTVTFDDDDEQCKLIMTTAGWKILINTGTLA